MRHLKLNHTNSFQIFQVFRFIAQVAINIGLAKTYLPLADLGIFESFLFITSSLGFFWITGLTQVLLSFDPGKTAPGAAKNSIFTSMSILLLILSIISITGFGIYLKFNGVSFSGKVLSLLYLYLLLNPPGFLVEYFLLLKEQFRKLVVFGAFSFILPPLFVSMPAFAGFSVEYCFYGLILWAVIKLLWLGRLLSLYSVIRINFAEIRELFIKALPLIITALLVGSAAYVDGYIITAKYNAETFAIYRYGARELPLFTVIASSFGLSMVPLIAGKEDINIGLQKIKKESKKMIRLFFPVAMVFLLSSQYIFPVVFNKNFSESYKVFDIYLLLIVSRFVFPQSILVGMQKHRSIMLISFVELLINIAASLILIYYFGYLGVAFGTVVAYWIEKILLIMILRRNFQIKAKNYIAIKEITVYSVFLLTIFIIKYCLIS